jgi:hypothetical protein
VSGPGLARVRAAALVLAAAALAGCAGTPAPEPGAAPLVGGAPSGESSRVVVVAVANPVGELPLSAGSTPGLYAKKPDYVSGAQAEAVLAAVARDHGLRRLDAWPIRALGLQCVTFLIPEGASRAAVLDGLARDRRVTLAQPLNDFGTLADPPGAPPHPTPAPAVPATAPPSTQPAQPPSPSPSKGAAGPAYNDPYLPLQRGLLGLGVPQAHRCARGDGVRVAVIDTGMDTTHPDLAGATAAVANFVDRDAARFQRDRHGTEVAGLIAAQPGNATGIVGVAPGVKLMALKACWEQADGRASCNSFTLSQALAAAIDRGAQVINLSLSGPADELLSRLLRVALARGTVVVGALPPSGARNGFPLGEAGVIAVQDAAAPATGPVGAPAREVLTLMPGGRYDFASGTSMAAAHVSGLAALLLQHQPGLDGPRIERLLRGSGEAARPLDACHALESIKPHCGCGVL